MPPQTYPLLLLSSMILPLRLPLYVTRYSPRVVTRRTTDGTHYGERRTTFDDLDGHANLPSDQPPIHPPVESRVVFLVVVNRPLSTTESFLIVVCIESEKEESRFTGGACYVARWAHTAATAATRIARIIATTTSSSSIIVGSPAANTTTTNRSPRHAHVCIYQCESSV